MNASVRYYVDILGFRNADWGNNDFTAVTRDGACIYLCRGEQGHPGTWAWVGVQDALALYAEYQASGARIRQAPHNQSWALEFQVEDPDGHMLRFGSGPLKDQPGGPLQ
jgi:catechol 2,3-dioxygenase-like lactoylglutathione lyase family enzyme